MTRAEDSPPVHKDEKEAAGFPVAFLMGAEDVRLCVFAPAAGRHQDGLAGFEGGREVQDALVRAAAEAQQNVAVPLAVRAVDQDVRLLKQPTDGRVAHLQQLLEPVAGVDRNLVAGLLQQCRQFRKAGGL